MNSFNLQNIDCNIMFIWIQDYCQKNECAGAITNAGTIRYEYSFGGQHFGFVLLDETRRNETFVRRCIYSGSEERQ